MGFHIGLDVGTTSLKLVALGRSDCHSESPATREFMCVDFPAESQLCGQTFLVSQYRQK